MEFYALPEELECWLDSILVTGSNWVLRWEVRPNTYIRVLRGVNSNIRTQWAIKGGPGPHFFIGNEDLCPAPIMRHLPNGSEEIDFLRSLCVRLVPSFVSQGVLLEGRVESFPLSKYKGFQDSKKFWMWRNQLKLSLKREVFSTAGIATQPLKDGKTKVWDKVFLSHKAINWFSQGGKLKQFVNGSVEIIPRLRDCP